MTEELHSLRTDAPPILWQIDGWRNADGTWTAEVYASGHGFGRCSYQKSWRTAIDKAMAAANESAAKE